MINHYPTTLPQAVERLLASLTDEQKEELRSTPPDELSRYHFTLGQYIRNEFGLWQGNDELLRSCYPEVSDPYLREIVMHDPDAASMRVIRALWDELHSELG